MRMCVAAPQTLPSLASPETISADCAMMRQALMAAGVQWGRTTLYGGRERRCKCHNRQRQPALLPVLHSTRDEPVSGCDGEERHSFVAQ